MPLFPAYKTGKFISPLQSLVFPCCMRWALQNFFRFYRIYFTPAEFVLSLYTAVVFTQSFLKQSGRRIKFYEFSGNKFRIKGINVYRPDTACLRGLHIIYFNIDFLLTQTLMKKSTMNPGLRMKAIPKRINMLLRKGTQKIREYYRAFAPVITVIILPGTAIKLLEYYFYLQYTFTVS